MITNPEEKALLADAYQMKREKQELNPADTSLAIQRGMVQAKTKQSIKGFRIKWITVVLVTAMAAGWFLLDPLNSSVQHQATYTEPAVDWGQLESIRELVASDIDKQTFMSALNHDYVQLVDQTVKSGMYQFTINAVMADENRITVLYTARTDGSQKMYAAVNIKMTDAATGYLLDDGGSEGIHHSNDEHTIYGRYSIQKNRMKPLPEQINMEFQLSSVVPEKVKYSENGEERVYQFSKIMNVSFPLNPKFSIPKTEILNVNQTFDIAGYEVKITEVELSPLLTRVRFDFDPEQKLDYKTQSSIMDMVQPLEIITTSKDGTRTRLPRIGGSGTGEGMNYSFSGSLLDNPKSMILKLHGNPGKVYDEVQEVEKDMLEIKIK